MSNVIGMNEFAGTGSSGTNCWLCQKNVSVRALFCHHCGTVQPVRDIDYFARLGIERRIDIDVSHLESQYAALSRTLDPQRFLIRGLGERGYAAKQLDALREAYETLSEPLRRGRYWLSLHEREVAGTGTVNPIVIELRRALDGAIAPSECDNVAQRAGHALEQGIMGLMQALRGADWNTASAVLTELDGLEDILGDVRSRRADLTGSAKP